MSTLHHRLQRHIWRCLCPLTAPRHAGHWVTASLVGHPRGRSGQRSTATTACASCSRCRATTWCFLRERPKRRRGQRTLSSPSSRHRCRCQRRRLPQRRWRKRRVPPSTATCLCSPSVEHAAPELVELRKCVGVHARPGTLLVRWVTKDVAYSSSRRMEVEPSCAQCVASGVRVPSRPVAIAGTRRWGGSGAPLECGQGVQSEEEGLLHVGLRR